MDDWATFLVIGFLAQMVDGALGMAYGVSATSCLLAVGLSPAAASSTVHFAETFTTGASALSHHWFRNIDRELFRRLVVPGIAGAVAGAWLVSVLPGDALKPWIAAYLLGMGLIVFLKAFRQVPPVRVATHTLSLGFGGAMVDSLGGGGWGPVVASTLLARGNQVRTTVGTVNAAEFFVALASSITFLATVGVEHWRIVLALAAGGAVAAPFAAWVCRRVPHRPMLVVIGLLIMALAARTLVRALG